MINNNAAYTILAVDDAKDTLMFIEFDLKEHGYNIITVDSGSKALTELETTEIDLILLDIYMPELSGLQTLINIRKEEKYDNIPVIMLSASDDEDEIVNALDCGAADYVTKPYITKVLIARIRTAIRLKEKNIELENLALTDYLTGLNNRKCFYDVADRAVHQRGRRGGYPVVIAIIDIDYFKAVNDKYGHDVGDIVLKGFSQLMKENFREYDTVARVGGEEFAVCMPNTSVKDAELACERFRKSVAAHQFFINSENEYALSITSSIGIASNHKDIYSLDELVKLADEALYQAKGRGRNQVVNFTDLNDYDTSDDNTDMDIFPGIDVKLGMKNVLDDENLFKEILIMFYQDHHQDVDKLRTALSTDDKAASKHLAHTLKGVASSIGATTLFNTAKILDNAINTGEVKEELMKYFDVLAVELNKVLAGIYAQLKDKI